MPTDTIPNPFASPLAPRRSPKRAFFAAIKVMLFVALGMAAVLSISQASQRWLIHHYTRDFDQLTSDEKSDRLIKIDSLGRLGIPTLVDSLLDRDPGVGRTALELIQAKQDAWSLLSAEQSLQRHGQLLQSLHHHADQFTADRTVWASSLTQSSLAACSTLPGKQSQRVRRLGVDTLDLLSLTSRGDRGLDSDGGGSLNAAADSSPNSVRIVARSAPLPLTSSWREDLVGGEVSSRASSSPTPDAAKTESQNDAAPEIVPLQTSDATGETSTAEGALRVAKSAAVSLKKITAAAETPEAESTDRDEEGIRPAMHLVTSPLETLDIRSVVHFLADSNETLRRQARSELKSRGWDRQSIELASRLVSGPTDSRLELIDRMVNAANFDPRSWLLFLLDDPDARIRLRAVSVLATMRDPAIDRYLREHDLRENDPAVRTAVRRGVPDNPYRR